MNIIRYFHDGKMQSNQAPSTLLPLHRLRTRETVCDHLTYLINERKIKEIFVGRVRDDKEILITKLKATCFGEGCHFAGNCFGGTNRRRRNHGQWNLECIQQERTDWLTAIARLLFSRNNNNNWWKERPVMCTAWACCNWTMDVWTCDKRLQTHTGWELWRCDARTFNPTSNKGSLCNQRELFRKVNKRRKMKGKHSNGIGNNRRTIFSFRSPVTSTFVLPLCGARPTVELRQQTKNECDLSFERFSFLNFVCDCDCDRRHLAGTAASYMIQWMNEFMNSNHRVHAAK